MNLIRLLAALILAAILTLPATPLRAAPPPGLGYGTKALGGGVLGPLHLAASGALAATYEEPEVIVRSLARGEIIWSKAVAGGIQSIDLEGDEIAWVDNANRLGIANARRAGAISIDLPADWSAIQVETTPDWHILYYTRLGEIELSIVNRRSGEIRLLDDDLFQMDAEGDWVVWYERNTAAYDVIAYHLPSGTRRTIDTLSISIKPSVNAGRVAYVLVETLDIVVYDLRSGTRTVYPGDRNLSGVRLQGDFLGWAGRLETGAVVSVMQLSSGARRTLKRPGDLNAWELTQTPAITQVWFDRIWDEQSVPARLFATTYAPVQPPAALDPEPRSDAPGNEFFEITGHNVAPPFSTYWRRNGGLPQFGYPLSARFDERNADTGATYPTQYFERQRFERHPENAGTAYEVLLGRLGAEILAAQGRDWRAEGHDRPGAVQLEGECQTFEATARTVCGPFLAYWRSHGLDFGHRGFSYDESLALFGLPLTAPRYELNADGDLVITQWFERARFEYHPGNPDEFKVLLGRLGAELMAVRGWGP